MSNEELTGDQISAAARRASQMRAQVDHACAYEPCGKTFTGIKKARFCCPEHRTAWYYAQNRERLNKATVERRRKQD